VTNVLGGSPLVHVLRVRLERDRRQTARSFQLDPGTGSLFDHRLRARWSTIKVNFTALPTGSSKMNQSTNFQNDVYMRSADPAVSHGRATMLLNRPALPARLYDRQSSWWCCSWAACW